jgi:hypothetical protein
MSDRSVPSAAPVRREKSPYAHCGGRRRVTALHPTRNASESRLAELGITLPSLLLPQPTAPPQLTLAV